MLQTLHKEALIWLSFSKERREMELKKQTTVNKRVHARPLPPEPRKELSFTWSINIRADAELYTSPRFLFNGYYLYVRHHARFSMP